MIINIDIYDLYIDYSTTNCVIKEILTSKLICSIAYMHISSFGEEETCKIIKHKKFLTEKLKTVVWNYYLSSVTIKLFFIKI